MCNFIDKLNKNKWWILGIALCTIVGTFATFYFSGVKPQLVVKVISEETIIDKEPLENFALDKENSFMQKRDSFLLLERLENIKIITLRIENTGRSSISENLYDTKRPLGIGLGMVNIICSPHFITPDNTLKKILEKEIEMYYPNKMFFPKLTLNSGESFDMQILVSGYHALLGINIYALGKIAGQDSIPVLIDKSISHIKVGSSNDPYYYIYDYNFGISDDKPKK
ncbi:hypothetical protein C799_02914 [Bacteroides thetaiotaomicron dnLKV9]|uniref:Uncharacterized protein n=1 Tax=Bacteroides thetaiotaomicron dnLKV9 TaxID=1235785 RepID=R9HB79_BACT4|nr:hypothetical protein [Bacteroides thetaiotaomicron]EOS01061.1 hypothetical protein C799_02914 [Bacteroides thetaiotaomicron dnLKV9]